MYFVQLQGGGGEEEAGEPLHCHRAHFQAPDGQVGQLFRRKGQKCEIFNFKMPLVNKKKALKGNVV
jgi:hypothetical protein